MKRLFLAIPLLAACGGSDEAIGDDQPADAGGAPDGPDLSAGQVVAVAGDFVATGILSTVHAPKLTVEQGAVAGIAGSDPQVRRLGDELFVINRFGGDNITVLDSLSLALVDQFSTGAGSNPQDVALFDDRLYVAALGADSILVIDRDAPTPIGEIDLATLDDDGFPDCTSLVTVGPRIFAVCGLLDNFSPDVPAKLVVIDPGTDTVVDTLDLPSMNPVSWLEEIDGALYVATVPDYTDYTEGCLVRISTGTTPTATCAIGNDSIDGFISRLSVRGNEVWGLRYAFDAEFNGSGDVVLVDLAAGTLGAPQEAAGVLPSDLVACGGHVFVADKADGAEGIRVYRIDGDSLDEITTEPLDIGLPPASGSGLACMQLPL